MRSPIRPNIGGVAKTLISETTGGVLDRQNWHQGSGEKLEDEQRQDGATIWLTWPGIESGRGQPGRSFPNRSVKDFG